LLEVIGQRYPNHAELTQAHEDYLKTLTSPPSPLPTSTAAQSQVSGCNLLIWRNIVLPAVLVVLGIVLAIEFLNAVSDPPDHPTPVAPTQISAVQNTPTLTIDSTGLTGEPGTIMPGGDFNGDGKSDVFGVCPVSGQWFAFFAGALEGLALHDTVLLQRDPERTIDALRFGDFNGDGKTDVFTLRPPTGQWLMSSGGEAEYVMLYRDPELTLTSQLRFGDFDGDGKTDVFRTTGSEWQVSFGGTQPWQAWNESRVSLSQLGFGDFNGDGKTDIFRTTGSEWQISLSGTRNWGKLIASSVPVAELRFGDFDGDHKTDVFRTTSVAWEVSLGATSRWIHWRDSRIPLRNLAFGDFDGDGMTDVFATGPDGQWLVASGGKADYAVLRQDPGDAINQLCADNFSAK
jgi:hypothetical protein